MQSLKISDLIPHPKNDYFFDDISGEKWEEFKKSIKESGVRTPIVVTDQMVIVSGNQRVRACKELGIAVINGEIRHYANEDEVIKDLIETNIRQRGVISDSEIKAGRRFAELQRINGNTHGGDRKSKGQIDPLKKQDDIAAEFGVSETEMKRLIRLSKAEPSIQELLENGKISKSTALNIISKLSREEQNELAEQLSSKDGRFTSAQVQEMMVAKDRELAELRNKPPETIVKEVEVVPDDYDQIKSDLKSARYTAQRAEQDFNNAKKKLIDAQKENEQLRARLEVDTQKRQAEADVQHFTIMTNDYLRKYGGHVWVFNEIESIDEAVKTDFIKAIKALDGFAQQLLRNLGGDLK